VTAIREQVRETDQATGHRHYIYPPTGERLTSVTTILSATEGKPWLPQWYGRIAAEFCIDNLDLVTRTLHDEGRQAAVILAKNQAALIRDRKADAGTYVHDVVEALVLWAASPEGAGAEIILPALPEHLAGASYDDEPVEDVVDWMVGGFLSFVGDFQPEFLAAEMPVFNQPLGVAGTLDLIAAFGGVAVGAAGRFVTAPGNRLPLCVDVKTGRNLDVTWREQVACYRRMRECLLPMGDIHPLPATEAAAVLHLRPEHARGYRLMLIAGRDDEAAWATFLNALRVYQDRTTARAKPGKVVYPARGDGTMPAPRLADLDGEGYGRALTPLIKAGVDDLEQLAAMSAGQVLAVKGVGGRVLDLARVMLADHGLHLAGEGTQAGVA
jgi:hypothetical protein